MTGGKLRLNDEESVDLQYFPIDQLPDAMINLHPCWLEDALSEGEKAFIR
ncbi:hypothetical protein J2S17_004684 [Cytobacillus purgationiresistens]|uniref:Uncharacterized protein n=1 Tax=Cytobacillus purgationiresistens TaxID=863449 RepID=A0ABU0AND0_9BACI|nr:hypothetical protein [Cytobacillus purgationiresistens]